MASQGYGITDARILQFCFDGRWEHKGREYTYIPKLRTEVEIDRFVRMEKLITTDHKAQLKRHLDRLVEEGWLYRDNDKYGYLQVELLGISILLLFVATYDSERVGTLMSNSLLKKSWSLFKDSLFYDICPFTQKFEPEGEGSSVKIVIVRPPRGSENIEKMLLNKKRRRTIEETINLLEHEKKEFNYYLLADPFADREVCDVLSEIAFRHQIESLDSIMEKKRFSDRKINSRLKRFAWNLRLDKLGLKLENDLNLWKLESVDYDEWSDPILSTLGKKYLSSKKFAVFLSTLVVSGAMFRYWLLHKDTELNLPISYRAILTEMTLMHPIELLTLLENGLDEKYREDISFTNYLGRLLVRPDNSKNEWQPVYALPYSNHSSLPSGHPYAYPLMALAILIHGTIESEETLSALSEVVGKKEIDRIEHNSFPEYKLYEKGLDYYLNLRDYIFNHQLSLIGREMENRTKAAKELIVKIKQVAGSYESGQLESKPEELQNEIRRLKIMNDLENLWKSDPEYED